MAYQLPFDILVLFAQAGGHSLAVAIASTCHTLKQRIDQRYVVQCTVDISVVLNPCQGYQRRPGVIGKFVSLAIKEPPKQLLHIPAWTLKVDVDFEVPCENLLLPQTLEHLRVWRANHSLTFPSNLHTLEIRRSMPKDYPIFPAGLKRLSTPFFPENLPQHLQVLEITGAFSGPVSHVPPNLLHLKMGFGYNHLLPLLPPNLQVLDLRDYFNHPLPSKLPKGLRELHLGSHFQQPIPLLPETLEKLSLPPLSQHLRLPQGLTYLRLSINFNQKLPMLPSSLKTLVCGGSFNQPVNDLPSGLEHLEFGYSFDELVIFPAGLKTLKFGRKFNQPVDNLPAGLKTLEFGQKFDQPVDNLPAGLRTLVFGESFNHTLKDYWSRALCLEKLVVGHMFRRSLRGLPQTVREVTMAEPTCDFERHRRSLINQNFSLRTVSLKFVRLPISPKCLTTLR